MLAVAVCDDEIIMQREIISKVKSYFEKLKIPVNIQGFLSGEEMLNLGAHFDIVFLDMMMKNLTGLETAQSIRTGNHDCAIIFITSHQDYVFDAFDVNASNYLIKPVSDEKLSRTLNKVMQTREQKNAPPCLLVKRGHSYTKILYDDIIYFESAGHKIDIHTAQNKVGYYEKLDALEQQLDGRFFRCHRAYIVNLDYVFEKQDSQAVLTNGEVLPVSKRKGQDLSENLLKRIRNEVL